MFRYKLKKVSSQEIKAIKELDEDIANPWADEFEKYPNYAGLQNDYIVEQEDITTELAAEEQDKLEKESAKDDLAVVSFDTSKIKDADTKAAIDAIFVLVQKIAKVLGV